MANLDTDSLFTLEIVVDKLSIPRVPCKFPAIAFRLLDFPTLMIYHVEPELGEKIKQKLKLDPLTKLGAQIPELLDREGHFPVKKGKSCLMKMSPNTLLSHLSSTPLYVMLIDTFPETPKLIGNCTIPLDETMNKVYDEICKIGLATPIVQGEKGAYKIYNLMGSEIGNIVLGLRILSLGVGLIPHLPSKSLSRFAKNEENQITKETQNEIQEQVADIVLEDFEDIKANIEFVKPEMAISNKASKQKGIPITKIQIPTQTEREILSDMGTQTAQRLKHKQKKRALDIESQIKDNVVDDIVVTNTVCPPPLFFNQDMEPKHATHFDLLNNVLNPITQSVRLKEADFADDDTIRVEDISDEEFEYRTSSTDEPLFQHTKHKTNAHFLKTASPFLPPNIQDFPILQAIMTEIQALTETSQPNRPESNIHISRPMRKSSASPRRRGKSPETIHHSDRGRSPSPRRERSSVENFVKRMQSPTHTVRELPIVKPTYDTSHPPTPRKPTHSHKCDHGPQGVPKGKSWLRKTPIPMEVKKTKLSYGLTNTQRLRLEKSNPELLKSMEKKEEERVRRFKEQKRLEEMARLQNTGATRKLYTGQPLRGFAQREIPHRKPVPTPRHTMNHSQESSFDQGPGMTTYQQVQEQYRYQYNATPDIDVLAEKEQVLIEESHKPASQIKVKNVSENRSKAVEFGETKVIQPNPGFPPSVSEGNYENYADDFEDPTEITDSHHAFVNKAANDIAPNASENIKVVPVDAGEELGLKQWTDNYPSDDSDSFKSARSHTDNVEVRAVPDSSETKSASPLVPTKSDQKPVHASYQRQNNPLEKSNVTMEASVDSTAYISRSQVYQSQDSENASLVKPISKQPWSHVPRVRRNTESVSSYEGEDFTSQRSQGRNYSDDSFNESDEDNLSEYAVPDPLSMKDLKISKEAKLGYTWAGHT